MFPQGKGFVLGLTASELPACSTLPLEGSEPRASWAACEVGKVAGPQFPPQDETLALFPHGISGGAHL